MDKFIFYYDVVQDVYIIQDYNSEAQGVRIIGKSALLYHGTMVLNADQIKDSLQGCIDAIYTKKPILYHGQDVNPLQRDILLSWHNGHVYETYSRRAQA